MLESDMKTCPYCRESVHVEAVKCRYCHSRLEPLLPSEAPDTPAKPGQVTYVLDRDLIRFAKFVGAVLAVFLVVGAYLFGFRLESALDEVKDTQKELEELRTKLVTAQSDLGKAQDTVRTLRADVEDTLAEAKSMVGDITTQRTRAVELVLSLRQLTPAQEAALDRVRQEAPEKVRRAEGSRYWEPGLTLRVRFLSGDAAARRVAQQAAAEWAKYANVNFVFVDRGDAEIRIGFDTDGGSWSYLGTEALVIPTDQPTISVLSGDRTSALHEFGHVLGLIEEHQNPYGSPLVWNRDVVIRELSKPPYSWDRSTIDAQVLKRVPPKELGDYRPFDARSIMLNRVYPADWTGGLSVGGARELSESDKALARRLYPGRV